MFLENLVII